MPPDDPVLLQRARAARLSSIGQRIGYALFALAIVTFLYGLVVDFSSSVAGLVIGCLVAGSIFLMPAIILGYAVKAAVRDDIEHGRDIGPDPRG